MSSGSNDAARQLAELTQIEKRARAATDRRGLGFVMVNDTRALLDYREAFLWNAITERIEAISGLAEVAREAPLVDWLARHCRAWQRHTGNKSDGIRVMTVDDLPEAEREHWRDALPPRLTWVPLRTADGALLGALLLARDSAPDSRERALLALLADAYAHAWRALDRPRRTPRPPRRRRRVIGLVVAGLIVVIACLPVRQSVLAPAEMTARDPAVIRAPLPAVVERLSVAPSEAVSAGQPLVHFDARELESRLATARQQLAVARAELRQAQQRSLSDARESARLAALTGQVRQAELEVDYLTERREQSVIEAPRAGVAIFDQPDEWIGRPVSVGERIMAIADPEHVKLTIQLDVGDAIALQNDAEVRFFLNADPANPMAARLERQGYRARPTERDGLAYQLTAHLVDDDPRARIGLRGTARLYGQRTPLIVYLLRRPLASLRLWLGV